MEIFKTAAKLCLLGDFLLSEWRKGAAMMDGLGLSKLQQHFFSLCILSFHHKQAAFFNNDANLINEANLSFFCFVPSHSLIQNPC